jgi:hypothetical protein
MFSFYKIAAIKDTFPNLLIDYTNLASNTSATVSKTVDNFVVHLVILLRYIKFQGYFL